MTVETWLVGIAYAVATGFVIFGAVAVIGYTIGLFLSRVFDW